MAAPVIKHENPHGWKSTGRFVHGLGQRFHATTAEFQSGIDRVLWDSRAQRLGRFPQLKLHPSRGQKLEVPPLRLWGFEWGNISWWVALWFTLGSVMWVINGYYAFEHPLKTNTIGYTAFAGGMLFWIGAYMAILQANNRERFIPHHGYDVPAVHDAKQEAANKGQPSKAAAAHDGALEDGAAASSPPSTSSSTADTGSSSTSPSSSARVRCSSRRKRHAILKRHGTKQLAGLPGVTAPSSGGARTSDSVSSSTSSNGPHDVENGAASTGTQQQQQQQPGSDGKPGQQPQGYKGDPPVEPWTWGLLPQKGTHRWDEVGYVSAFVQFIGATLFSFSVTAGFPGVLPANYDANYQLWNWLYWSPQLIGSIGFMIASVLGMLEVQKAWYIPNLTSLGWHVGFWNLIGAFGFWLSPFFGYYEFPAQKYQHWGTAFSTYVGGYAFLLGSYMQLVETLNPHRVPLKRRLEPRNILNVRFW